MNLPWIPNKGSLIHPLMVLYKRGLSNQELIFQIILRKIDQTNRWLNHWILANIIMTQDGIIQQGHMIIHLISIIECHISLNINHFINIRDPYHLNLFHY